MTTTVLKSLQILKPEIQRIIDNNKVYDIVNLQLGFFKKNNYFNFTELNNSNEISNVYLCKNSEYDGFNSVF
jgi:hypothetical protein